MDSMLVLSGIGNLSSKILKIIYGQITLSIIYQKELICYAKKNWNINGRFKQRAGGFNKTGSAVMKACKQLDYNVLVLQFKRN